MRGSTNDPCQRAETVSFILGAHMISLTYVSTAESDLGSDVLLELLRDWRPHNADHERTGMLLYNEGNVI